MPAQQRVPCPLSARPPAQICAHLPAPDPEPLTLPRIGGQGNILPARLVHRLPLHLHPPLFPPPPSPPPPASYPPPSASRSASTPPRPRRSVPTTFPPSPHAPRLSRT